jgi:PKD repeat protein
VLSAYSGTNTTTPVQQDALSSETVSRTTHTTPKLTTSLSGAWLLSYWSDISTSTSSWTAPAGQATRETVSGTAGAHVSTLLTDLGGPLTVGQVGGYTATANSASAKAALGTLVLAPEGVQAPNQPPTASFTNSCSALACSFTGTSTDPDGTIASSAWTFGDGGTSALTSPTHTYAGPGIYNVSLTVTDDQGATDTSTQQITVSAASSNVSYVASATAVANSVKATVTVPSAVAAGNGMVLIASTANATTTLTAPAGWTQVGSSPAGSADQTVIWQQVATASSAGSSVSVTLGATSKVTLVLAAYSGTKATLPVTGVAFRTETASTATHTTPTLTTSATGAWLLSYWSDVSADTSSWATQAGQVNRASVFGTGGAHVSSVLSDLGGPLTVGTVGGYTATSNSASAKATMATLVLASS